MQITQKKLVIYVLAIFLISVLTFFLARSGDLFLSFLGKEIRIEMNYRNHSGFRSCFIKREVELKNPIFTITDADLLIGAESATLYPDFSRTFKESIIILKCEIKNASLLEIEEKFKGSNEDILKLGANVNDLLDEVLNILFFKINTTLLIDKDSVHFETFEATSENIKIIASGFVNEAGDFSVNASFLFSPEIVSKIPEKVTEMLRQEENGWFSYSLRAESGKKNSYLKFESDLLKIDFRQIVTE